MEPNRFRYLESLANEVIVQSRRVRDLIGDRHWLSDGHHKEYLLADLIRRHLPAGVCASRGFVIKPTDPFHCSKEQDILIYDATRESPVFNQGGIAIVFPQTVIATISVKTQIDKSTFIDTLANISSLFDICGPEDRQNTFFGGYFYEYSDAVRNDPMITRTYFDQFLNDNGIKEDVYHQNLHLCLGADLIYRLQQRTSAGTAASFCGFDCASMATGVFLANLIEHICFRRSSTSTAFSEYASFPIKALNDKLD